MLGTILKTAAITSIGAAIWDTYKLDYDIGPEMKKNIRFNKDLTVENIALFASGEYSGKKESYSKIYTQVVSEDMHFCDVNLTEMFIEDPRITVKYESEIRAKCKEFTDPLERILVISAINSYISEESIVARSAELLFDFIKSNNIKYVAIDSTGIKIAKSAKTSSYELVRKLIETSKGEVKYTLFKSV